jgi:hypothetical protein
MADYYTFGVVPADIGRYLPRVAFDATSQPTLTDAVAIIDDHAADLCAFLTGMGLSVQGVNAQPTTAMYRQCQRYILMRFAAQVIRARSQNSQTLADRLDEEADALMKRLREIPPDLCRRRRRTSCTATPTTPARSTRSRSCRSRGWRSTLPSTRCRGRACRHSHWCCTTRQARRRGR